MLAASGNVSATLPVEQSPTPCAAAETVLTRHALVAAPWCDRFGIGIGGPKRQPAFVHCRNSHTPPGQSAFELHGL